MSLKVTKTEISGLLILETTTHRDERGNFTEMYNQRDFASLVAPDLEFVQDNLSVSNKNVLRGLHFQVEAPQGKLVRVNYGAIFDVAVDIRKGSKTFGSWFGIELSAVNKKSLWIPEGFAHGFLALKDNTEVMYKVTNYYHPSSEKSIFWQDPDIGIKWPNTGGVILSPKDAEAMSFKNYCEMH